MRTKRGLNGRKAEKNYSSGNQFVKSNRQKQKSTEVKAKTGQIWPKNSTEFYSVAFFFRLLFQIPLCW